MRIPSLAWATAALLSSAGCATADGEVDTGPTQIGQDSGRIGADGGCGSVAERCNDVDDDCDGTIDEGLVRACGEAPAGCSARRQTCEAGRWGACAGEATGVAEICDGADDDCDGTADEGLSRPCGTALGECAPGTERCADGDWVDCDAVGGTGEVCDGATDEDCDGTVDEGCDCAEAARTCGGDIGRCSPGEQSCVGGRWGACEGGAGPTAETCDGTDEDCDGTVDEGAAGGALERACGSAVGRCVEGRSRCIAGDWSACADGVEASLERCDGTDEDCDGTTDEGVVRTCGSEVGACRTGEALCVNGGWGACGGAVEPAAERCDGARTDEDCDGQTDEGCDCEAGDERPCGSEVGACSPGAQRCVAGEWGGCEGGVDPVEERCDGADHDCDGRVDEGCECVDGSERPCGIDVGACEAGVEVCAGGGWGACEGATEPASEDCEGANDEDCDGANDEDCDCVNGAARPCGRDVGECRAGEERCADGRWGACVGGVEPAAESCGRGADEDCDGMLDEGFHAVRENRLYAELSMQHPNCAADDQRWGDNCMSAIHRLCGGDGCHNSGFGPVENGPDDVELTCVVAERVEHVSWARLRALVDACDPESPFSQQCIAAADQYCSQAGAFGGYGPVEYNAAGMWVVCLDAAHAERVRVRYVDLQAQHPPCNGVDQDYGSDCSAAVHRFCRARGAESGVGPVEFPAGQPRSADVICVSR